MPPATPSAQLTESAREALQAGVGRPSLFRALACLQSPAIALAIGWYSLQLGCALAQPIVILSC